MESTVSFTTKEITEAKRILKLYRVFLTEHNVNQDTVNANILWQWPNYWRTHSK